MTGTQFPHRHVRHHTRNVEGGGSARHAVEAEQQFGAGFGATHRRQAKALDSQRLRRGDHDRRLEGRFHRRSTHDRPRSGCGSHRRHERRREGVIRDDGLPGGSETDADHRRWVDSVGRAHGVASAVLARGNLLERHQHIGTRDARGRLAARGSFEGQAQLRARRHAAVGIHLQAAHDGCCSRRVGGDFGRCARRKAGENRSRRQKAQCGSLPEQVFFHIALQGQWKTLAR